MAVDVHIQPSEQDIFHWTEDHIIYPWLDDTTTISRLSEHVKGSYTFHIDVQQGHGCFIYIRHRQNEHGPFTKLSVWSISVNDGIKHINDFAQDSKDVNFGKLVAPSRFIATIDNVPALVDMDQVIKGDVKNCIIRKFTLGDMFRVPYDRFNDDHIVCGWRKFLLWPHSEHLKGVSEFECYDFWQK